MTAYPALGTGADPTSDQFSSWTQANNGLVDDLPHIQAAIDSVAAACGGGLVSLPPGT